MTTASNVFGQVSSQTSNPFLLGTAPLFGEKPSNSALTCGSNFSAFENVPIFVSSAGQEKSDYKFSDNSNLLFGVKSSASKESNITNNPFKLKDSKFLFGKQTDIPIASKEFDVNTPPPRILFGKVVKHSNSTQVNDTVSRTDNYKKEPYRYSSASDNEVKVLFGKPVSKSISGDLSAFSRKRLSHNLSDHDFDDSLKARSSRLSTDIDLEHKPAPSSSKYSSVSEVKKSESNLSTHRKVAESVSAQSLLTKHNEPSHRRHYVEHSRSCSSLLRRASTNHDEDVLDGLVTLKCKDVPRFANNALFLKLHFSKFGDVVKVLPNQSRATAIVQFSNHAEASHARKSGHIRRKDSGPRMQIMWQSSLPPRPHHLSRSTSKLTEEKQKQVFLPVSESNRDNSASEYSNVTEPNNQDSVMSNFRRRVPLTKSDSPTPKITGVLTSEIKSLLSILKQQARNTSDKVLILDARDKLIRLSREKMSDLSRAEKIIGTCQYMCPEKERYDRDNSRQLSIYEVLTSNTSLMSTVDHSRAIKEYSRSSADKEESLPHELRPGPVLESTMNYLLSEVANYGEDGKWGEWFDFLWNRTRSIRKDITQQMLCDRTAISLTEKSARFHIFCSLRLCEEDPNEFDSKINNENLTKCLQSLKELYHDMLVKNNSYCPSEPEFRSYTILMNLNEGDILREVQMFRSTVRESREVKFALSVYSALNSNNYSRFFKLVKVAPFLSACILHRYFTQVRVRALLTIAKAYQKQTQFPLLHLVKILEFEGPSEALAFCTHYNFDVTDGLVFMDLNKFQEPEFAFQPVRAVNLIEHRRGVSIGEIINGGQLDPVPVVEPTLSFDENGYFIGEYPEIGDVSDAVCPAPVSSSSTSSLSAKSIVTKFHELSVPNEVVKDVAKSHFLEVINEMCREIGAEVSTSISGLLRFSHELADEFLHQVLANESWIICSGVYEEETLVMRKEKEDLRRRETELKERIALRERSSQLVSDELTEEVVRQEMMSVFHEEMKLVEREILQLATERAILNIAETVLSDEATNLCRQVLVEFYKTDVLQKKSQLQKTENFHRRLITSRLWCHWKKVHIKREKKRLTLWSLPCGPSQNSPRQQLASLLSEECIENTFSADNYLNTVRLLAKPSDWLPKKSPLDLQEHQSLGPINLMAIYKNYLCHKQPSILDPLSHPAYYVKIVVSLPHPNEARQQEVNRWFQEIFSGSPGPSICTPCPHEDIQQLVYSRERLDPAAGQTVPLDICISVSALNSPVSTESEQGIKDLGLLYGSTALWFLTSFSQTEDSLDSLRLSQLLDMKPPKPALPLVIIVSATSQFSDSDANKKELMDRLKLDAYRREHLIGPTFVLFIPYHDSTMFVNWKNLHYQVVHAVEWSAAHHPESPKLLCESFCGLIEDVTSREFYGPILNDFRQRKQTQQLHQTPEILIALFNHVVDHVTSIALNRELCDISWPPVEFTTGNKSTIWNSKVSMDRMQESLHFLRLPHFIHVSDSGKLNDACKSVLTYLNAVVSTDVQGIHHRINLFSRVSSFMDKFEREYSETHRRENGHESCQPPWVDVILAVVDYKLSVNTTFFNDDFTIYFGSDSASLETPKFWSQYLSADYDVSANHTRAYSPSKHVRDIDNETESARHDFDKRSVENTTATYYEATATTNTSSQDNSRQEVHHMVKQSLADVNEAKLNSALFNSYLEKVLYENDGQVNEERGVALESPVSPDLTVANAELKRCNVTSLISCLKDDIVRQRIENRLFEQKLEKMTGKTSYWMEYPR